MGINELRLIQLTRRLRIEAILLLIGVAANDLASMLQVALQVTGM